MNADIENHIKIVLHTLIFSKLNQKEKCIHHNIPEKPWEVIGANMFTLSNKNDLCIVDYHSKIPIMKKAVHMSADNVILAYKILFFSEFGLPKNIMSDTGGNFISE